jgi:prolyl oligopeptidase
VSIKQFIFIGLFLLLFKANSVAQHYEPILTQQETKRDTFFHQYIVSDPYRWLENTDYDEVRDWMKIQNRAAEKYLLRTSTRHTSNYIIDKFADVDYNFPKKHGKYYFKSSGFGIGYSKTFDGNFTVLAFPMKANVSVTDYSVSKDSKLLAYQFCENGTDRMELKIVSIGSGFHKKDHLVNLRFGESIAWKGDGFFYSRYDDTKLFAPVPKQELYFHKIGTEQAEDQLIFNRENPSSDFGFFTTDDERFFIVYDTKTGKDKMNIYYIDYQSDTPVLKPLIVNIDVDSYIIDYHEGKFIAFTNHNAKNGCIAEMDPADPYNWKLLIPEFADAHLLKVLLKKDRIVVLYKSGPVQYLATYNYKGEMLYNLELPPASAVGGISSDYEEDEIIFSYTTYILPHVVCSFNTRTFELEIKGQTTVTFDHTTIAYKVVNYPGKDSTLIPMTLVYNNELKLDGKNPLLLDAYGGFGTVDEPYFDPGVVYFVKTGGIYAFANIRGGGEKGVEWAEQGKGKNKQTSFDDFIAAAEYLIKEGYTNANKLAATGASHGGLVVAAAAIQRPELFKTVVPVVAATDMIRFEKFTVGRFHTDEFGSVKDSLGFLNLYSYSPYHNIKEDVNYPSMLIMTSEFDDRVPPHHSYKFAARLQSRAAQTNPILLKIEKKGGHSDATDLGDMYGFIMDELTEE